MTQTMQTPLLRPACRGACAAALALASWLPAVADAAPVTWDFNELATTEVDVPVGRTYTRDGFVLSTDGTFGFSVIGPAWTDGYAGSAGLLAWGGTGDGGMEGPGTLRLRRTDGGTFDFNGLSLGGISEWWAADVTFNAFDVQGRLLDTITVPSASIGLSHFNAIDFGDRFLGVSLVSWQQAYVPWQWHQIDDVRLDQVASVPEPGSLSLLGAGILMLGTLRRRHSA